MGPVHKELTTPTCTTKINAHEKKKLWAQSIKREIFLHRKFLRLRYSHTKIKIKNKKEKNCVFNNKYNIIVIQDNNYINSNIYIIHPKIYTGLERGIMLTSIHMYHIGVGNGGVRTADSNYDRRGTSTNRGEAGGYGS